MSSSLAFPPPPISPTPGLRRGLRGWVRSRVRVCVCMCAVGVGTPSALWSRPYVGVSSWCRGGPWDRSVCPSGAVGKGPPLSTLKKRVCLHSVVDDRHQDRPGGTNVPPTPQDFMFLKTAGRPPCGTHPQPNPRTVGGRPSLVYTGRRLMREQSRVLDFAPSKVGSSIETPRIKGA